MLEIITGATKPTYRDYWVEADSADQERLPSMDEWLATRPPAPPTDLHQYYELSDEDTEVSGNPNGTTPTYSLDSDDEDEVNSTTCFSYVSKDYSIDQSLADFEKTWLNPLGYIPFGVSSLVGSFRIAYATVMVVAAIAAAVFEGVKALFGKGSKERALEILHTYTLHAVANATRGLIETIFPHITILGGLLLAAYDLTPSGAVFREQTLFGRTVNVPSEFKFGFRITYPNEKATGQSINSFALALIERGFSRSSYKELS